MKTQKRRSVNPVKSVSVARTLEMDLARNTGNLRSCVVLSNRIFPDGVYSAP